MNVYRHMKIRAKLMAGFLAMVFFVAVVGGLGVYGLNKLNHNTSKLLEGPLKAQYWSEKLEVTLHQERIDYRDVYIERADAARSAQAMEKLNLHKSYFVDQAVAGYISVMGEDIWISALRDTYQNQYLPELDLYLAAINAKDDTTVYQKLEDIGVIVNQMEEQIAAMVSNAQQLADSTAASGNRTANILFINVAVYTVITAVLGVFLAFLNARHIATPMSRIVKVMEQAGALGDFHFSAEAVDEIQRDSLSNDETGIMARTFHTMINALVAKTKVLEQVATGDLTVEVPMSSEQDTIGTALRTMLDNMNSMFGEVSSASIQVATGSEQIAQGAQALATGASQQAATLEQLSAAITEVLSQSKDNSKQAEAAVGDLQKAGTYMDQGMASMQQMTLAMNHISESSRNISKVIKVIDDIAFQTNILALNAAVEAARAGQHGKGFAVVANEVRNLASKSAEAAKETAVLIENSVSKVEEGNDIVQATSESLRAIAEIAGTNATSMTHISQASQHQSQSIAEITQGITEISSVVQENSATSEESAASSQEISAQARMLESVVSRFKIKNGASAASSRSSLSYSQQPEYDLGSDSDKYGSSGFSILY